MASIYDTVKAEFGDAPKYATKSEFTTFYGYAKGAVIGSGFPTKEAAIIAGATSFESSFDKDGFDAETATYREYCAAISAEWHKRLRAEYPEINDKVFNAAYLLAYDRGHSTGMGEVELYLSDYVEFAVEVIAASKEA